MNISLLIGLKNNLNYNKHFYQTTRELYPTIELCFSSYNSTDGTNEWLDEIKQSDPNVKCWWSDSIGTFSDNFNKAAEIATNDYVMYLHNDIVLSPGFVENIEKHLNPNRVVSYTTIEPPIFAGHERPGKIIQDFGTSLESFKKDNLFDNNFL
jgi:glycosyltransferase involved in cell wall biosynthesis